MIAKVMNDLTTQLTRAAETEYDKLKASQLRPGRGVVLFTVTGPASDGPLTLVKHGFTAL